MYQGLTRVSSDVEVLRLLQNDELSQKDLISAIASIARGVRMLFFLESLSERLIARLTTAGKGYGWHFRRLVQHLVERSRWRLQRCWPC